MISTLAMITILVMTSLLHVSPTIGTGTDNASLTENDSAASTSETMGSRAVKYNIGKYHYLDLSDGGSIRNGVDIKLTESGIRLDDDEVLLFADNFTGSTIDGNRWSVQEGSGTVLTTADELIAFKEGWEQTGETFIESHRFWQVERRLVFEWNSITGSGMTGYEHEIDVYRSQDGDDRIWITIKGDRQVRLQTSTATEPEGPPFILAENRWYEICCKLTTDTARLRIRDKSGNILNYQNLTHDFYKNGNIRFLFAKPSPLKANFEIRLDNVSMFSGYKKTGSLTTVTIPHFEGFEWDRLKIDKDDTTAGTAVTIDIIDSTSDAVIPGFQGISSGGYDISPLNEGDHTGIYFKIDLKGNSISTPEISGIAVSWQELDGMQDIFIDDSKISSMSDLEVTDNKLELITGEDEGYAISRPVELPPNHYWGTVLLDKFEPAQNSYLTFSVIDFATGEPIDNYTNLYDDHVPLHYLDPIKYTKIMLRVDYYGYSSTDPVLHAWSVNWTKNRAPEIIDVLLASTVYRGDSEAAEIFVHDADESNDELTVTVSYRHRLEDWQTEFLGDPVYKNGIWVVNFSPSSSARTGFYSYRIVVTDFFGSNTSFDCVDAINVVNKPLGSPDAILSPSEPTTLQDLKCFVTLPPDIEADLVTINYRWYKNGVLQPGLNTDTVRCEFTAKYESWRCEVRLFDGIEEGKAGVDEVFIQNSPPKPITKDITVQVPEDGLNETGIALNGLFTDADADRLNFTVLPIDNIDHYLDGRTSRIYFTPDPDWYGRQTVFIYASDDSSDTFKKITLEVLPLNDAPVITVVGNQVLTRMAGKEPRFNALEGETLKLQVFASDIDGDPLMFSTDRTDGKGDDDIDYIRIDEKSGLLSITPPKGTLGAIRINITVSDNNGSNVWTDITINVQEKSESEFSQILLTTNWLLVIVGLIVITIFYYGFTVLRSKYAAYRRKKYREKLSGMGRLYAHYPIALTTGDLQAGRYPKETDEFTALKDPYRAARYALSTGGKTPERPDDENK